jgi:hypothetical protein
MAKVFRSLHHQNLSDQIVEQIGLSIMRNVCQPSDARSSEPELSLQFNVSRPIVLEGIAGTGAQLILESDIFVLKHLSLQGIFGASSGARTYAVQLFSSGHIHLAPLISHRFAQSDYQAALDTVITRQMGVLKVLLVHDESGR